MLKLPDWPPVATGAQSPPPELLLDEELELEDEELLELELLEDDELELELLLDEELLLDDELELLLEDEFDELPPTTPYGGTG